MRLRLTNIKIFFSGAKQRELAERIAQHLVARGFAARTEYTRIVKCASWQRELVPDRIILKAHEI